MSFFHVVVNIFGPNHGKTTTGFEMFEQAVPSRCTGVTDCKNLLPANCLNLHAIWQLH